MGHWLWFILSQHLCLLSSGSSVFPLETYRTERSSLDTFLSISIGGFSLFCQIFVLLPWVSYLLVRCLGVGWVPADLSRPIKYLFSTHKQQLCAYHYSSRHDSNRQKGIAGKSPVVPPIQELKIEHVEGRKKRMFAWNCWKQHGKFLKCIYGIAT